jgi:hypothetical protein
MKGWRTAVAVTMLVGALGTARPARAGYLDDAGWGSLTVITNVVYMPAKLLYATTGALTGGLAFALTGGDMQTAETVWVTTMGGTYVVTPGMLQGQEPIVFTGTPAPTTASADVGHTGTLEERQLGGS